MTADHTLPAAFRLLRQLGFGARRLRVMNLLMQHPEFDAESYRGELIAQTERGGQVRGDCRPTLRDLPLVQPTDEAA